MPTTFGPQLIGETEKTLNALLRLFLEGTGLTESQWVTLRLAARSPERKNVQDTSDALKYPQKCVQTRLSKQSKL
jgi:hypothetical protein